MTILSVMDVVFPARRLIFDATCSGERGKLAPSNILRYESGIVRDNISVEEFYLEVDR